VELPLYVLRESENVAVLEDISVGLGIQRLHRLAEVNAGIVADTVDELETAGAEYTGEDRRARVLVVDDEPDMRRYLVSMLTDDYRVVQATDGLQGYRLAQEMRPDLMLLDLMLPEMDGLEVCRRLKSQERTRRIRIVLLTARVDEEAKLTALKHGADDFVTKPFSRVEVKSRLANLLSSSQLESSLASSNDSLRQALEDLRRTQAQLIQSEKLNALGSLAAGLLHEINNPLNYCLTALQLLASDPSVRDDELRHEMVADIDEGMQRIRVIVSDLRSFAYPSEAQRQERFDLNDAVEAALRFTAHELRGIEVEKDLPTPAWVSGSKSHLTQVLINLLTNGAKAIVAVGGARQGRLRIAAERHEGRLWVRVADNGVGMDEATLSRVFDPFFTTRDVGEGMGLGLSICHTIVANHQGRLTASSRQGEGSELAFDVAAGEGGP
jgi:C4-dicarboxylate-specific signal transduction histidine kinase